MAARISVKAIVPKRLFSDEEFQREIVSTMKARTRPLIKGDYDKTVSGWSNPPIFTGTVRATPTFIRLWVRPTGPNAAKYNLVVVGSPRHPISPRSPRGLVFRRGPYRAATRRGRLGSQAASRSGPLRSSHQTLMHPGFEGRDFYELIAKNQENQFRVDMNAAMARGAARLNANMR